MGLYRPVTLVATGPVALRHPQVVTKLNPPANDQAELTVKVFATNATKTPVTGTLKGAAAGVAFQKDVALAAGETREIAIGPKDVAGLALANPKLWWPAQVRRSGAARRRSRDRGEGRGVRPPARAVRHPRVRGRPGPERPRVPRERPPDPDPGRRLDLRDDAALLARALRAGDCLRQGHGPQHHPARGQARGRSLLRHRRPRGHPRHAGLVLLRPLGEMEGLGRGGPAGRHRVAARSDPPPSRPAVGVHLAEWLRQPASGQRRESLSRHREDARLPESRRLVGHREERGGLGRERRQDAGALRVGAASLLVHGHEARGAARLRHRDRPGARPATAREPEALHSR